MPRKSATPEERAERYIRRLVDHLQNPDLDPRGTFDISPAGQLPGWMVYRSTYGKSARWVVLTPADRPTSVPWAVPPAPRELTREEAVEALRELWLPEAVKWLHKRDEQSRAV